MLNQNGSNNLSADAAQQNEAASRFRTVTIIWVSFLLSIVVYVLVVTFVPARTDVPPNDNPVLVYSMLLPALMTAFMSFVLKRKLLDRAAASGKLQSAQSAHIVAFALCETGALIGVALAFATRSPLAYVPMAVGFICLLLHKPKRDDLILTRRA